MQNDLPGKVNPSEAKTLAHPHPSEPSMPSALWTIGHSTRPIEEFIQLLQMHGIQLLADVRMTPYSRRNPQFHSDALAKSLADAGIQYRHMPELGGRRKTRLDSMNVGWRNESFRGYADYMQTQVFWRGLEKLIATGRQLPVAIMCAEAVPWRCHRTLIADALVSRGRTVQHIISINSLKPHTLTPFANLVGKRLIYSDEHPSDFTLPLFD